MQERLAAYWANLKLPGPIWLGLLGGIVVGLAVWLNQAADQPQFATAVRPPAALNEEFIAVNNPPPFQLKDPFRVSVRQSTGAIAAPRSAESAAPAGTTAAPQAKLKNAVKLPKVTGTVFNNTKRLAIIEYQQGSIVCQVGDSIGEYTIAAIEERLVRLNGLQGNLILEVGR